MHRESIRRAPGKVSAAPRSVSRTGRNGWRRLSGRVWVRYILLSCDRVVTVISGLGYEALPSEIAKFLIATSGFVAFMRTRQAKQGDANAHSKNSEVFVGSCPIRPSTIESMIRDGLLKLVGSESMTGEGVLEYFELTEAARDWATAYR